MRQILNISSGAKKPREFVTVLLLIQLCYCGAMPSSAGSTPNSLEGSTGLGPAGKPNSSEATGDSIYRLPLLANALDYLGQAVNDAAHARSRKQRPRETSEARRRWKYAVLNLQAGVELLVKARLEQVHWSLVFANIDDANWPKFTSGEFVSVSASKAMPRLVSVARLDGDVAKTLLQDFKDSGRMGQLRALRNRLQHFDLEIDLDGVVAQAASTLGWALEFYDTQFPLLARGQPGFDRSVDAAARRLRKQLATFRHYSQLRMQEIEEELHQTQHVWDCPVCSKRTLVIAEDRIPRCLFCRHQQSSQSLAEQLRDGFELGYVCCQCDAETLVFRPDHDDYWCTTCGWINKHCRSCNRQFVGEGDRCVDCRSGFLPSRGAEAAKVKRA